MAERAKLKVGFIPIIDCAPVVLADELGAFERQGLEVEIRREVSWANVRDKLALGLLDASHILAPLPLALTLGIDSVNVPTINAMTLQVNGNALTLSHGLWREMEEAAPDLVSSGHATLVGRVTAHYATTRGSNLVSARDLLEALRVINDERARTSFGFCPFFHHH